MDESKKIKRERGGKKNYPLVNLDETLKVAEVVEEMRGKATKEDVSRGTGNKGGGLLKKIAAARRWGLIEGQGTMEVTPLAMDILHPEKDEDVAVAKLKAYFGVPIFKTIYETYGWELPRKELLINILVRQGVPKEDAKTLANLIFLYKTIFDGQIFEEPGIDGGKEKKIVPIEYSSMRRPTSIQRSQNVLTQEKFDLIVCLGRLKESLRNFDKVNFGKRLEELTGKISSDPIVKGHLDVLKSDISYLEEETLDKILPSRIDALTNSLKHILGLTISDQSSPKAEEKDADLSSSPPSG